METVTIPSRNLKNTRKYKGAFIVRFVLAILLGSNLFHTSTGWSASDTLQIGYPVFQVIPMERAAAHFTPTDLAIDQEGRCMLVGEGNLIEYSSGNWKEVPFIHTKGVSDKLTCISIAETGRIFAGAVGNWGSIERTEHGLLKLENCPPGSVAQQFSRYRIDRIETKNAHLHVFGYKGLAIQTPEGPYHTFPDLERPRVVFQNNDGRWLTCDRKGVYCIKDAKLSPEPLFAEFSGDASVIAVADTNESGELILATQHNGLWLMKGHELSKLHSFPLSLQRYPMDDMIPLNSGQYAVLLQGKGIFVVNKTGQILDCLDRNAETAFATVTRIKYDSKHQILWALYNTGIIRIPYPANLRVMDERCGLVGAEFPRPHKVDQETFWIHGEPNIYEVSPHQETGSWTQLERIKSPDETPLQRGITATSDGLLLSTAMGIYQIQNDHEILHISDFVADFIHVSKWGKWGFAQGNGEATLLWKSDGIWKEAGERVPMEHQISIVVGLNDNECWAEQGVGRVARITQKDQQIHVKEFSGIPGYTDTWTTIWTWDDRMMLQSDGLLISYQASDDTFCDESAVFQKFSKVCGPVFLRPTRLRDGTFLTLVPNGILQLIPQKNSEFRVNKNSCSWFREGNALIFQEPEGEVFLSAPHRLYQWKHEVPRPDPEPPSVIIHRVIDSDGNICPTEEVNAESDRIQLPFSKHRISFSFDTESDDLPQNPAYRTRISRNQLKSEWSEWQENNRFDFFPATEGHYLIEVQARNGLGQTGCTRKFEVVVIPPWVRSPIAIILFAISSIMILALIIRWIISNHHRQQKLLELTVAQRTDQLQKTNTLLERSIRNEKAAHEVKKQFIANVSHELRTPMIGVLGAADLLEPALTDEEHQDLVSIIRQSGNSMLNLITQILDYSKLEFGADKVVSEPYDLLKTIEDCVSIISATLYTKNLSLIIDYPVNAPRHFIGDGFKIRQVLLNLLSNAVKFTEQGSIRISWVLQPDHQKSTNGFTLSVKDTGVGIPPDQIGRIFEPYHQADNSNTRRFGGTGLGLAISARLVQLMHGNIQVQSQLGTWTEFTFHIPDHAQPQHPTHPKLDGIVVRLDLDTTPLLDRLTSDFVTCGAVVQYQNSLKDYCDFVITDIPLKSLSCIPEFPTILIHDRTHCKTLPPYLFVIPDPLFPSKLWDVVKQILKNTDLDGLGKTVKSGEKDSALPSHISLQDLHVLVAEDSPLNRKMLLLMLQKIGLSFISEAINGEQAVSMIENHSFDIILLDIQLPKIDGFETARLIRNIAGYRYTPIIAVTASVNSPIQQRITNEGMDGVLPKPFSLKELEDMLIEYLPVCRQNRIASPSETPSSSRKSSE